MPAPDTPRLRQYQGKGVDWMVDRLQNHNHKAVLLADPAGLGKTRQALTAAERLGARRILVICPAGARRVWWNEIERWFPTWVDGIMLVEPGGAIIPNAFNVRQKLILIIGYDDFSFGTAITEEITRLSRWDLLVLDEAHYLKSDSKRTKAIYGPRGNDAGVQAHANRVILLTGTPTPNNAGELYHHCRAFWPHALPGHGSLPEFEEKFCRYKDTVYGRQVTGSRNQAELRTLLDDVILRRKKEDVLPELPPLIVQDSPLNPYEAGTISDLTETFDMLEAILPEDEDEMLKELGKLASIRRKLGLAKVTATVAWVHERMESTDKIILFCWHLEVIERLKMRLLEYGPVVVTGSTSPSARAAAVHAFQNRDGTRLFIGQILAAGVSITLTAASEVAIVEPSWVPGENHQAICRAHRLGQRDSVLASFLYLPDTLDETVMHVFRRKAREIAELEGVS